LNPSDVGDIGALYGSLKPTITGRLARFRALWREGSDERLFHELVFCLLTPSARAHAAWETVCRLVSKGMLTADREPDPAALSEELKDVRFRFNKARALLGAHRLFCREGVFRVRERLTCLKTEQAKREWLAHSLWGMGYKESSHFLRNVGFYRDLTILDRHVLRNLARLGVIDDVPANLSRKRYLAIEEAMQEAASLLGMPASHLDLLLWYRETGEIFK
jgi:N-glycosylase/DNA lyase